MDYKKYDSLFKNYSKKDIFEFLVQRCLELGLPYSENKGRGRKSKLPPEVYVAYLIIQKMFGHDYRQMEMEAELYLDCKIDHSTFARNYAKISQEYFERLIASLPDRDFSVLIADSTGMSTKVRVERVYQGTRNKTKLTQKCHIVIGYDPRNGEVMILGAKATDNHVSDSQGAQQILKEMKETHAWFLGDSAYNTYALHEVAEERGLNPQLKPDAKGIRKKMSAKARNAKNFKERLYKELRGVVETVFGGATNAGLILTRSKKTHTRQLDTLILAIRHNIFAYLKANTPY